MTNTVANWLFWRTEQDAAAWADECGRGISRLFGVYRSDEDTRGAAQVVLHLPTVEAARDAWSGNHDLTGKITITLSSARTEPLNLGVPLPLDGVFIARRQDSDRPLSLVWGSWLGEAPGFRLVRPTSQKKRNETQWRIGLPGGYFVGAPCRAIHDLSAADVGNLSQHGHRRLCDSSAYPEWMRPLLGAYGPRGVSSPHKAGLAWREIHEAILDRLERGELQISDRSDQDDLAHRSLITFPVWLIARLCDELLRAVLIGFADRRLAAEFANALRSGEPLNKDRTAQVWSYLVEKAEVIASRLVPLRRTRINDEDAVDRTVGLQFVDPVNPVDLAAQLTRVKRLPMTSGDMGELPAEYRQNHPSFRGRLCPVTSPESELVGLTLQLATGATVGPDGRIQPGATDEPINELGYGAGLIPFFQHNDGARSMMGAKNLRQALPVAGRTAPMVKTGGEKSILQLTSRLTELGICPSLQDNAGALAVGVDLLVAYLPWYGMNFEDAIVVGEQVVDSGVLDVAIQRRVRRRIKAGWTPCRLERLLAPWDGMEKPGAHLTAGSVIASFSWGTLGPFLIRYNDRSPAVLRSIRFERPRDWMDGVLEYELEKRIPLRIGDKLMGRHGNKGVVGAVIPPTEMPRLPDDSSLPEALRGRPIDVVLNPHGVISRMNIGQLLETHVGWLLQANSCADHDLLLDAALRDRPIGYPFAGGIDHDKIRDGFEKTGLDEAGRIQLLLPSGDKTFSPVVVGFQHIVRLRHIPELKAQARRGGVAALYSRKSGQAVQGRVRGGGQRVGEMEVWALASHQAEHILEELLGGKADADWATRWLSIADTPPKGDLTNGFPAMLNDWLYALLIDAVASDGQVRMSFATPDEVVRRIGPDRRVETGSSLRTLVTAIFHCHAGKEHSPCEYTLSKMGRIAVPTAVGKDGRIPSLKVGDFLAHIGLALKGPVFTHANTHKVLLQSCSTHKDAGALSIEFSTKRDQLKAVISPGIEKERPPGWPEELDAIFAYGRFASSDVGKNVDAVMLLSELMDPCGTHRLSDLSVTCPRHKTVPMKASPPFGERLEPEPRGLFDAAVFGPFGSRDGSWSPRQWGFIQLPVEIRYPLDVFLSSADSWRKLSKAERKKKTLRFLDALGLKPEQVPPVRVIPVLPSRYRMPLLISGEPLDDPLVVKGYRPLLVACRQYRQVKSDSERARLAPEIEQHVANLFSLLTEGLRNKSGLIRTCGLGRRVDRSARLVIAPNPSLTWDQAGVPAAVLLELLGDRIQAWLDECGRSDDLLDVIRAAGARSNQAPDIITWSWSRSPRDEVIIARAKELLDAYLGIHPDTLVLLNRQPSLHRDSFQAFVPVALGPEAGDVIQICPLTCRGFGADFDGDEMVIHLPVSKRAQDEAKRLLPSNNLYSMASHDVLAHFAQDFVMGSYWASEAGTSLHERLLAILPDECCRSLAGTGRIDKKKGTQLLDHLAHNHPDRAPNAVCSWMKIAFECCSRVGVSFGFYDLLKLKHRVNIDRGLFTGMTSGADLELATDQARATVEQVLTHALSQLCDWSTPALHFAAMAVSGARGNDQTLQIVGSRGFLNPGATGFLDPDPNKADLSLFAVSSSLVEGMTPDEAFWAAMNARSSMCDKKLGTGQAGDLTRQLVFALWPFTTTSNDCGSRETQRCVLTCRAESGCCSACYGCLPEGAMPAVGFPAGLIAAQSIGERGTQLSMQSFHTGQRAFTIGDVRKVLGSGDKDGFFNDVADAARFVGALKGCRAYGSLQDRHFHVLWRVIRASPDHTLASAIKQLGGLSRIAFQRQAREIATAALKRESCPLEEPSARVLYNLFGARNAMLEKG